MQRGLKKIMDLGAYWEEQTGAPIPLGGIIARKSIEPDVTDEINALIVKSLAWSYDHYPELSSYVRDHSQEMEESVMRQHIDLYVNNYSSGLGVEGHKAVNTLLDVYHSIQAVGGMQ